MSLTQFIRTIKSDLRSSFILINHFIKNDPQKFGFNLAIASENGVQTNREFSLKDIFDGFVWHAPRKRRSLGARLNRKFGYIDKYQPQSKLIKKKHNLIICEECGNYHESFSICQFCYLKVKEEAKQVQEAMIKKLGLNPVEKKVTISYKGERENAIEDDRYFIEIPKERPVWFNSNLISNSVPRAKDNKTKIAENNDLEWEIKK